jgi:hypothetical protein
MINSKDRPQHIENLRHIRSRAMTIMCAQHQSSDAQALVAGVYTKALAEANANGVMTDAGHQCNNANISLLIANIDEAVSDMLSESSFAPPPSKAVIWVTESLSHIAHKLGFKK